MGDVNVTVHKKRVKNMSLRIRHDGTVHASVPSWVSDAQVSAFLRGKEEWLARHRADVLERSHADGPLADGDVIPLWGEPVVLHVAIETDRKRSHARHEGDELWVLLPYREDETDDELGGRVQQAVRRWYVREVEKTLPDVAATCEERVGRHASSWSVRHMTSRWGSCNVQTGAIHISSRLAQWPSECLEQVVTHELCHLIEAGHGPRFHELMDRFLPSWHVTNERLRRPPLDSRE